MGLTRRSADQTAQPAEVRCTDGFYVLENNVQHTNYCRQALPVLRAMEQRHPRPDVRREATIAVNAIGDAKKFMIPSGGRILPDAELRAIDPSCKLSLPFPVIALEYTDGESKQRRITLATERDDDIALQHLISFDAVNWVPTCLVLMPREGFVFPVGDGVFLPNVTALDAECPEDLALEPAVSVLSLLNALACSNVHIERSEPKKAGKKIKAALPFDAYHVLTIDVPGRAGEGAATGGHRSPREHLRRGHIRRLGDSRRIWVNATVVASGRGGGVIAKDYAVRCAA